MHSQPTILIIIIICRALVGFGAISVLSGLLQNFFSALQVFDGAGRSSRGAPKVAAKA
jgi:hypothetical protein